MTYIPIWDGPCLVKIDALQGSNLELLGYTEDGAEITMQAFHLDVHGDQNGGMDGPPIDIQYLGEIAVVRLVLTTIDMAVLAKITARVGGGTDGTNFTPGSLLFTDQPSAKPLYHRLLLTATQPTGGPRHVNFPIAVPRDPHEHNKGTKHRKHTITYHAYKNASSGLLWNTTAT